MARRAEASAASSAWKGWCGLGAAPPACCGSATMSEAKRSVAPGPASADATSTRPGASSGSAISRRPPALRWPPRAATRCGGSARRASSGSGTTSRRGGGTVSFGRRRLAVMAGEIVAPRAPTVAAGSTTELTAAAPQAAAQLAWHAAVASEAKPASPQAEIIDTGCRETLQARHGRRAAPLRKAAS